jgi:hypothetical protein
VHLLDVIDALNAGKYLPPHVPAELRNHYGKYLETPNWRRLRLKILRRNKTRCEVCLKAGFDPVRKAQHVHHLTYERLFFERVTDLAAVCFTCHAILHPGNEMLAEKTAKDEVWVDPKIALDALPFTPENIEHMKQPQPHTPQRGQQYDYDDSEFEDDDGEERPYFGVGNEIRRLFRRTR